LKGAASEEDQKLIDESAAEQPPAALRPSRDDASSPRRRGSRHVPAPERREVFRRDGGRCSYVDARGERCCETRYLELHHLKPFASGGANVASNLTLRCAAHNALAAEKDFGRERIARKRDSRRHESRASQA
jgi:5-methylcytosine-specific restriction endonuclease McrA